MICPSCGGVVGRDCFNTHDCAQITQSMNDQNISEPYIEALNTCRETIQWMADKMEYPEDLIETLANKVDNTLALIESLSPTKSDIDWDSLPF